jgi:hypothetical protein
MGKNSYIRNLTASQILFYVLRCISEGKSEEQIAERFNGDTVLVKTWIDALKQIHYVATNQFNELVITSDGKNYLQKFDSDR